MQTELMNQNKTYQVQFFGAQPDSVCKPDRFFSGDTAMKEIPLTQGQFAIVNDDDFEELSKFNWFVHKNCYGGYMAVRHIYKSKQYLLYMHRQIMNCPQGMDVDHKNHNTLDNRKENLRICTRIQNMQNSLSHKNSSSKYKGVHWHKPTKKWQTQIGLNNKRIFLGYFDNEEEAAKAYNRAAIKYFGEFAYLNFPQ